MSKTFEQGKEEIAKLCQYFSINRQAFLAPGVKEAHVRQSLIDPFFESLGWDVRNSGRIAPQYREVIPEDSLDVEGHQKAPDYTFRVGTLAKFYVEAKKCGVNINADPAPAYQLRRYGWSAKVALSILTDFEELGVYDCTSRPRPSDKASQRRIQYLRFEEYPDHWRELWDVFSREAAWSGAFDQYVASKRKRGTSEVDVEFLKEIEGWRDVLARNIALRNKELSSDDLNAAVQLTIDRVIFLRMAEDRALEPYEQLLKLCERGKIYQRFMRELCRKADQKYNSGLFHFQKEPGISEKPDRITPKLRVDDKVFKPILESLYFAHGSPYHFGVLPVEILGTVYERFLGKVIRLTAGHRAKVEEKPEVRKAGGVYYTPAYIVDYIVKHTVGTQIKGKSPAQLAGGKNKQPFRIMDMACGSGSFLLGAYQYLLDHVGKWYAEHNPERKKKAIYKDPRDGHWRLTIEEKKRILTTHIFGVDIDSQAVEVSKLSLLLKVLEGETDQSVSKQMRLFHERALPNLADNIKCGNSLIGPDYFTDKLIPDPEEIKRVNPFDWKQGFPDAMQAGGFDCIIGNPPYVLVSDSPDKSYLLEQYRFTHGKPDLYRFFIEKAHELLGSSGRFGYIIPSSFLATPAYASVRKYLLEHGWLRQVVCFWGPVFANAQVNSTILITERRPGREVEVVRDQSLHPNAVTMALAAKGKRTIPMSSWNDGKEYPFLASDGGECSAVQKMIAKGVPLDTLASYTLGMQVYHNSMHSSQQIQQRVYHNSRKKDKTYWRESTGANVKRYSFLPKFREYVSYGEWCYNRPPWEFCSVPRILIREITGTTLVCAPTATTHVSSKAVVIVIPKRLQLNYLLGILNSRAIGYFVRTRTEKGKQRLFPRISLTTVRSLPIPAINPAEPADKAAHDRMVSLVESMLALHKQLAAAKSEQQKAIIQRQIDATDAEIDKLVYGLYGLTEAEIAIVEEANK
ncbi:MAG: N-6 DNA methylase [Phycisphaerae bacterium]|nr:N-6 DNA methylase [Phycisphaerae bacterium]